MPHKQTYQERMKWFHEARFGMFIHWGLYSVMQRGEWAMYQERIPPREYARLADRFRPNRFDPAAWAGLAVEAGAKYACFTTRHHDGFCLFDSQVSDFTSVKTAARRDFVAEVVNAFRAAGLKVGLYYSLLDWRFPAYWRGPKKEPRDYEALIGQAREQVRELLTQYGKIDVLWYDGDWFPAKDTHFFGGSREPRWGMSVGEFWRSKEINAMARRLQPHLIINNRSGVPEDIDTPEQVVKASKPGRAWESVMTIGDFCGWGYIRHNPNQKSPAQLIQYLVEAASGEGNYMLNIGPKANGVVPAESASRLRAIGQWMAVNGEAIYGSQRCPFSPGMLGLWTRKGATAYLHVFRWPGEEAIVAGVGNKVRSATLLATGKRAHVRQESNGRLVLSGLPARPPHPSCAVIKVELDGEPVYVNGCPLGEY
ncbi:MAG TPA: alpha-L-fucosidase [Candidatus Brocadiia bacterium]|nr:alpha-L-fucosidase [Candidatus Brocadiia bacterium]